jgi:hypothetical protein
MTLACALACASSDGMTRESRSAVAIEQDIQAPLAGEALVQRKIEMRRAYRDIIQFGATAETLRLRRDRSLRTLQEFLVSYEERVLNPLLDGAQVSEDPELAVLDAELRLVKAELWIETNDYWNAGDVIDDIDDRYGNRHRMLVRYPIGQQSTLDEALEFLRQRNRGAPGHWSGVSKS